MSGEVMRSSSVTATPLVEERFALFGATEP
jgi:hypothetical protein